VGLIIVALGEAINQPLTYAGAKQCTDERTSSIAYGLIYAFMNLGIFLIGLISPLIRVPLDEAVKASARGEPASPFLADGWIRSGVMGVNWFCTGLTALGLLFLLLFLRRGFEPSGPVLENATENAVAGTPIARLPWTQRVANYFLEGPFSNARFVFFIFMLLPVQTLFAHQWLTVPTYVLRAYPASVANRMEWVVNWINPGIIFFGVPVAAALTRRINVYTMMLVGSAVSAVPTFLLAFGPNFALLIAYLVLFSIGEALWQPRFLQYATELAPEGRVAQYMGLANVPWITAKMTTGLYSGAILSHYCPPDGPQKTQTMWLIYGLIAVTSPIGLLLGRKWVMSGTRMK
jgi:hypothetical protein